MGTQNFLPSKVNVSSVFPLEPGFAITIHKAQGRTIHKVILCLSSRHNLKHNPEYAALYVALSRVKCKEDIRFFLHLTSKGTQDLETLTFVDNLKPDKSINAFFEGFKNDTTEWNAEIALQKYNEN